jgi:hypothetical protein
MRDMRRDRTPRTDVSPMAQRAIEKARLLGKRNEAYAQPMVVGGAYDRSAIMIAAIAQARYLRSQGCKDAWSVMIGAALKTIWANAKAVRKAGAH